MRKTLLWLLFAVLAILSLGAIVGPLVVAAEAARGFSADLTQPFFLVPMLIVQVIGLGATVPWAILTARVARRS